MLTPSGQSVGNLGLQCSDLLRPLLANVKSNNYKNHAQQEKACHLHTSVNIPMLFTYYSPNLPSPLNPGAWDSSVGLGRSI